MFSKFSPSPPINSRLMHRKNRVSQSKSISPHIDNIRKFIYKSNDKSLFDAYTCDLSESKSVSPTLGFYKKLKTQCSCLLQIRYFPN
jgi:hypothetical protein